MNDQSAHTCDKGPLIDRLEHMLDGVRSKMDSVEVAMGELKLILKGNGIPGLATEVQRMGCRVGDLEKEHLTRAAIEEANNRQFKKIAAFVGLVVGVFSLIVILAPLIQGALGMIAK